MLATLLALALSFTATTGACMDDQTAQYAHVVAPETPTERAAQSCTDSIRNYGFSQLESRYAFAVIQAGATR